MFTREVHLKRKSCGNCVKAKRKCDLATPKCKRCTKQDLRCEYLGLPTARQVEEPMPALPTPQPTAPDEFAGPSTTDFDIPSWKAGFGHVDTATPAAPAFDDGVNLDDMVANTDPLDFLVTMADAETQLARQPRLNNPSINANSVFSLSALNDYTKSRLLYSVQQLKMAPANMVYENQLPWSHYRLYDDAMPRCVADAYGACALHLSKTEANSEQVARHIETKMNELLRAETPTTLSSTLAHAQALILYQSIQVFSDDFRAHAQAVRGLAQMENFGYTLHMLLGTDAALDASILPAALPVFPTATAEQAWRTYILHESGRRTMLVLFFFLTLLHTMQGDMMYCQTHGALSAYLIGSSYLWHAPSAFDFAKAWNDKRRLIVDDLDFGKMIKMARPDDIDVLGRMLLVAYMGVDDVRGWFDVNGAVF